MSNYQWIFQRGFPYFAKNAKGRYKAMIGIGANIGNPTMRFKLLFNKLLKYPNISVKKTSPIFKNPPFGYEKQPDFYNAIIWLRTNYSSFELLNRLLFLERGLGRKRTFLNAPRTIDLDLIFFENLILYNKRLILPHPGWRERISVLAPFASVCIRQKWRA